MNKALVALLFLATILATVAATQEDSNISFQRRALSSAFNPNKPYTEAPAFSYIVSLQAAIWVVVTLVIVLFFTLRAMLAMDDNKEQDTILYAKFLANVNN
jgi:hypothetical protein